MPEIPRLEDSALAREVLGRASVLYTDLDGTLLGRGGSILTDEHGNPTTRTAETIVALNGAGLDVVPVSGRGRPQLTELVRMLGWSDFIGEVGSLIVRGRGREVFRDAPSWPDGAVPEDSTPWQVIRDAGALSRLTEAFPGRIEEHDPWNKEREVTHVLRGDIDLAAACEMLEALSPPVAIVDNGVIHPPRTGLRGVERVHAYHLMPPGISKHRALALDLGQRGLSSDDAVAVGDSLADLDMAYSVELMVLVANALDDPMMTAAAAERENVVVAEGRQGAGWAELAKAWMGARRL